jgi:hypothetical protein
MIINFPNMCSNIPASPAYSAYISQCTCGLFNFQLWRIYQWKKFCKSRIIDRYNVINIPVCEIKGSSLMKFKNGIFIDNIKTMAKGGKDEQSKH